MNAVFLLLLFSFQEKDLHQEEILRISSKPALTDEQRAGYESPGSRLLVSPKKIYNLAVLPVSFSGGEGFGVSPYFGGQISNYYKVESGKALHLAIKQYPALEMNQTREVFGREIIRSQGETKAFSRIIAEWVHREGKGILALHDGVAFLVRGGIGARGSALWPHQGFLPVGRVRLNYIVIPKQGGKYSIGIAAHEFGHLLGLKDRYDMKHHCLMGTGYKQDPPASLCTFCRIELGWIPVADISSDKAQSIVLKDKEALRVSVNPAGTEKMILTVRKGKLEIWRERPGKEREYIGRLPSRSQDRCTPLSQPGFVGSSVGAREAWLTDIRSEKGCAWFHLSITGHPTPREKHRQRSIGHRLGP